MPVAEVTVVIPTHNRRRLLLRTLHSVLSQRDVDLSVVVVDDGGADDSGAAVAGLQDDRVSVIRHPQPRGVSAARNTGIAAATTQWLAFVDDDDLWSPGKLRAQLDALGDAPDCGWSCTGAVHIDLEGRSNAWPQPPNTPQIADLLLTLNVIPGGGSGVMASRDLTQQVGGFDEALSNIADWDFYIRLSLQSPVATVSWPHVGYTVHPQGMAHDVRTAEREYGYLDLKYERERRRRGVTLNREQWKVYIAALAYNGGDRVTGIRTNAELVLQFRRWRSIRSLVRGVVPDAVRPARSRNWRATPPEGWQPLCEAWLEPYRHGWLE
jgi:glycosyltransferase involved in cell wall biosynthesis